MAAINIYRKPLLVFWDNTGVTPIKRPKNFGPVASFLSFPFLIVFLALALPYNIVAAAIYTVRERSFRERMRDRGRTIEFAEFLEKISSGKGTLIVERFSFEGPIRHWWIGEDFYEECPFAVADWLTMTKDDKFTDAVEWCNERYTGSQGQARLVLGTKEQWKEVRGSSPLTFRDNVRWVEVPPRRR